MRLDSSSLSVNNTSNPTSATVAEVIIPNGETLRDLTTARVQSTTIPDSAIAGTAPAAAGAEATTTRSQTIAAPAHVDSITEACG